ncbi:hypothetical protein [Nocardioides sp. TF02-7]|uniref:hypothetical protein n=1 Tax=Nocardioides sp. TF02-7 TaxID=2917724 RepID=UPI001F070BD6|nr:hypothetical protein [Nocardioides sp. TF02-7]UMG93942.1 hypothetical protein MF408_07540 [Nocardioides sp. TF02-7]
MSDEQDKLKVSLEPPKLFGRKKKSDAPTAAKKSTPPARRRPAARPAPAAAEAEGDQVEVAEVEAVEVEAVEVEAAEVVEAEAAPGTDAADSGTEVTVAEEALAEAPVDEPAPAASRPRRPVRRPVRGPARPGRAPRPVRPVPEIEPEPVTTADLEDAEIAAAAAEPEEPLLTTYRAAAVTGAVVGIAAVVLTWLTLRGCEAVRDTSSCGGGTGIPLLIAIFVVCVLLGSSLLKAFLIPDPGSTSFMAVALVAVVALLFLIDVLDHWSMLLVVPLLAVAAYLASVWITKTFVDPADT